MATIKATKNGLWSDTTVWDSAAVPGIGDTAYSNGYTVVIDQDIEVDAISAGDGVTSHFDSSPGGFKISPTTPNEVFNITGDVISGLEIYMYVIDSNVTINIIGDIGNGNKTIGAIYPNYDVGYSYSFAGGGIPIIVNITGDVRSQRRDEYETAPTILVQGFGMISMIIKYIMQVNINGDIIFPVDEDDGRDPGGEILKGYMANGINVVGDIRPEIFGELLYGSTPISMNASKISVKGDIYCDPYLFLFMAMGGPPKGLPPFPGTHRIVGGVYIKSGSKIIFDESADYNMTPFFGSFFLEDGMDFDFPVYTFPSDDLDIPVENPTTILTNASGSGDCPEPQDVRKGVVYGDKTGLLAVPQPQQVAFGIPVDQSIGQAAISLPQLSTITGDQIEAAFEK